MSFRFSDRAVALAALGGSLWLFGFWAPPLFELLGGVNWGTGFALVTTFRLLAVLATAGLAVGVLVDARREWTSAGVVTRVAAGAALLFLVASLPAPVVARLDVGGRALLIGSQLLGVALLVGGVFLGWLLGTIENREPGRDGHRQPGR